jgi:hypothetical protein
VPKPVPLAPKLKPVLGVAPKPPPRLSPLLVLVLKPPIVPVVPAVVP